MKDELYCPMTPGGVSLRCNFGGGRKAPDPPKPQKIVMPKMPEVKIPPPPPPPEPIPPPPTATSADVAQAEEQARQDAKKRKGIKSTVLAGETGGYQGALGGGTVLGGSTSASS
jgi:hypothetical protein